MVTVVNTPAKEDSGSNMMGFLVILIIILAIGAALFYYGLPMLNRGTQPAQPATQTQETQINNPADTDSGSDVPQINVPEQIDVNVNQQPNQ